MASRRSIKSSPNLACYLDPSDWALLMALVEHERLSRSDVTRRAIRSYAKTLGVTAEPAQPQTP